MKNKDFETVMQKADKVLGDTVEETRKRGLVTVNDYAMFCILSTKTDIRVHTFGDAYNISDELADICTVNKTIFRMISRAFRKAVWYRINNFFTITIKK